MTDHVTLKRHYATVELADGTIHDRVRIVQSDVVAYEETAQKHRWPGIVVSNKTETATPPFLDHADRFQVWAALTRLELYKDTWEQFKKHDLVDFVINEEDVTPTQPGPDPG